MKPNVTQVIVTVVLLVILSVATSYNGCSKVSFETSPDVLAREEQSFVNGSKIIINGDAEYTNVKDVGLTLNSPRAVEMKISDNPDCSGADWEPYVTAKAWRLKGANDQVAVYAQFKNLAEHISPCVSDQIVHDDIPPTAAFERPSGFITNQTNMTIRWVAADNLSGVDLVRCWNFNDVSTSCMNELAVTGASEGNHHIRIQVRDRAGNESPELSWAWMLDKTPPQASINSGPATISSGANAAFNFTGYDELSGLDHFMCSMDGAAATSCSAPAQSSGLGEGPHKFIVYAVDVAGNSSAPAEWPWRIDLTAPTLRFTQTPPLVTSSIKGTFAFEGSDNGQPITEFECRLDAAAFSACPPPRVLDGLSSGKHNFEVRGRDSAGNMSDPIRYEWLIDTTAPNLHLTQAPPLISNGTSAEFGWTASDSSSGIKQVECSLNHQAFAPCPLTGTSIPNLSEGAQTLEVRAVDGAGNVSAPIAHSWNIDLTLPTVLITSTPGAYVGTATAQITFIGSDANGILGYECRLDSGSYAACSSPDDLKDLSGGGHVFFVRAIDKAGNVSLPASATWTIDVNPPIIHLIQVPTVYKYGESATIQYEVLDPESGVQSVLCGMAGGPLGDCPVATTITLPSLAGGNYTFDIQATDKVGNVTTEHVSWQVTSQQVICDPFTPQGEEACGGGLLGNIYYLDSAGQSTFKSLSPKTVDFFYTSGIRIDALLNLKQLFVSTRPFSDGFPASDGQLIKDNSGNVLYEYFAFRLKTVLKLNAFQDSPGWYQLATLSDDGSMILLEPQGPTPGQTLVSNDGDHSTRMGCSTKAIYIDDQSRLPLEIKYYQGPATQIAMVLMWRQVSKETAALDTYCGTSGNDVFFGPWPHGNYTDYAYATLISPTRGWRVIDSTNFLAPQ